MEVMRWDTMLFDLELNFKSYSGKYDGVFCVEAGSGGTYSGNFEVIYNPLEPHFIIDEEFLMDGVNGYGATKIVKGSLFSNMVSEHIDLVLGEHLLYVILTSSLCLGVYSSKPPIIRRIGDYVPHNDWAPETIKKNSVFK